MTAPLPPDPPPVVGLGKQTAVVDPSAVAPARNGQRAVSRVVYGFARFSSLIFTYSLGRQSHSFECAESYIRALILANFLGKKTLLTKIPTSVCPPIFHVDYIRNAYPLFIVDDPESRT